MKAAYDALVRQSQPVAYWPLGRYRGQELVSGLHFTTFPVAGTRYGAEDHTELGQNELWSRTLVSSTFTNMSVELWFWCPDAGGMALWQNGTGGSNGYSLEVMATTMKIRGVGQGNQVLTVSTRAVAPRIWHHVILHRVGTNWGYYIDGEPDNQSVGTGINTPTGTTQLGGSASTEGGRLKGVALYHRILAASEIREHYLMGAGNIGPQFVAASNLVAFGGQWTPAVNSA